MKQPALLLTLGVIAGVASGAWLPTSFGYGLVLLSLWRWPMLVIGIGIGLWRILLSPLVPPENDIATLAGREADLSGVIDSFPDQRREYQQFVVEGTAENHAGRVLVQADPLLEFMPGDQVTATGLLTAPRVSDDFDYRSYLAKDGIHSIMRRAEVSVKGTTWSHQRFFYSIRRAWVGQVERTFPEPTAGFILGILIGERSTLSDAHLEAFRRTGTTHILALSGFNISIIIAAIVWMLGRKPAALVTSLLLIGSFVLMVGPSASVVRAALMGGFLLLGQLFGRPQLAMYAAILTAAGMLMIQPHALRYDLGFDLSFLATLGILWLEPDIRERLLFVADAVRGIISATLAAGLTTAPLIALTFGTASIVAPLANLVIVPVIPLLMLGGFVSVALSFVTPELAQFPALVTAMVTNCLLGIIEYLSAVPLASVTFSHSRTAVAGLLIACTAGCIVWLKRGHA